MGDLTHQGGIFTEAEFLDFTIGSGQQIREVDRQRTQGGGGHQSTSGHVRAHHDACASQLKLCCSFLTVSTGDQPTSLLEATGAEDHVEVGCIAWQGRHQTPATIESCLHQGFVEGGVRLEHLQAAFLSRLFANGVQFDHQHRRILEKQLLPDLTTDPAVAAENDVVLHAPQHPAKSQLPNLSEVTGF